MDNARRTALRSLGVGALALALTACGFTPVYGPGSAARQIAPALRLADPTERLGYLFVAAVEERLPPSGAPLYDVSYSFGYSAEGLDTIGVSRVQIEGSVTVSFVERATGRVVLTDEVKGFVSVTNSGVLSQSRTEEANERLMQILADKFVTLVMLRAPELLPQPASEPPR